jgi:hypothetical protein
MLHVSIIPHVKTQSNLVCNSFVLMLWLMLPRDHFVSRFLILDFIKNKLNKTKKPKKQIRILFLIIFKKKQQLLIRLIFWHLNVTPTQKAYITTFQLYWWKKTSSKPPCTNGNLRTEVPTGRWIASSHEGILSPWRDSNSQPWGTSRIAKVHKAIRLKWFVYDAIP